MKKLFLDKVDVDQAVLRVQGMRVNRGLGIKLLKKEKRPIPNWRDEAAILHKYLEKKSGKVPV